MRVLIRGSLSFTNDPHSSNDVTHNVSEFQEVELMARTVQSLAADPTKG